MGKVLKNLYTNEYHYYGDNTSLTPYYDTLTKEGKSKLHEEILQFCLDEINNEVSDVEVISMEYRIVENVDFIGKVFQPLIKFKGNKKTFDTTQKIK